MSEHEACECDYEDEVDGVDDVCRWTELVFILCSDFHDLLGDELSSVSVVVDDDLMYAITFKMVLAQLSLVLALGWTPSCRLL